MKLDISIVDGSHCVLGGAFKRLPAIVTNNTVENMPL